MWLNSRRWLVACDSVTSALSAVLSTRVWRRRKFGEVSCTECTVQRNDFKLIPTVDMETRNPVEGYFGSEFPAVCNHCWVTAAWSLTNVERRKTLNFWEIFVLFGKTTPYGNIFKKTLPKIFIPTGIDVLCSNFVKFGRLEIGVIVAYLRKTKLKLRLALPLLLLRRSRQISDRVSSRQFT